MMDFLWKRVVQGGGSHVITWEVLKLVDIRY